MFWKTGEMPKHDEAAVEGLDDMEMQELPGYPDYVQRVRWRLIPRLY